MSTPDVITYDDFLNVDIRCGLIKTAEPVPKSEKLVNMQVYFGEVVGTRTIVAGIAKGHQVEDLPGRSVLAVINLAPRKLMGIESHGMLLAGSLDNGLPRLALCNDVPPGTRIG